MPIPYYSEYDEANSKYIFYFHIISETDCT